jgi:hypothetical protein
MDFYLGMVVNYKYINKGESGVLKYTNGIIEPLPNHWTATVIF